jgi:acetyl esterase
MNPMLWLLCRRSRNWPPTGDTPIAQRRAAQQLAAEQQPIPDDGVVTRDIDIDLGDRTLPVRLYRPPDLPSPAPAYLMFHAGGFFNGNVAQLDRAAHEYAIGARCVVASVGYRLAPEHPWPAATDDGWAAWQWLHASGAEYGVDPARLAIGGVSAGANIAAVTAIRARDEQGPRAVLQVLEVPVVDLTQSHPSMTEFATGYITTQAELTEGNNYYAPDPQLRRDPRVSPLFAPDLAGLPPAFVLTCQFDPLRDEGEAYVARLRAADVPVDHVRARGHIHGSTHTYTWWLPSARWYRRRVSGALRKAFGR